MESQRRVVVERDGNVLTPYHIATLAPSSSTTKMREAIYVESTPDGGNTVQTTCLLVERTRPALEALLSKATGHT